SAIPPHARPARRLPDVRAPRHTVPHNPRSTSACACPRLVICSENTAFEGRRHHSLVRFGISPAFNPADTVISGTKMKFAAACMLALPALACLSAHAASEPTLESMATCQDSWLDWKDAPARGEKFIEALHAGYTAKDGGYLVPKTKATLFGLPVTRVYPES